MFCSKCGQQIPDNSVFCRSCGAQIAQGQTFDAAQQLQNQYMMQKNAIRQSEIQALDQTIHYFYAKKPAFDELKYAAWKVRYYGRGAKSGLIVWGAIISVIALLMLIGEGPVAAALLAFLLPGQLMILGGILMKVNNRVKYKRYLQRYDALFEELYHYYIQYPNCPVGYEFFDDEILTAIMDTLQSGRADTVKEALDLLSKSKKFKSICRL